MPLTYNTYNFNELENPEKSIEVIAPHYQSNEDQITKQQFDQLQNQFAMLQQQYNSQKQELTQLKSTQNQQNDKLESHTKTQLLTPKTPQSQQQPTTIHEIEYTPDKPVDIKPSLGSPFELTENEIILSQIIVSNQEISETPSSPNAIIFKDINTHNVIYDDEHGIIHGNPLLLDECMNALTIDHEINILNSIAYYYNEYVPWFWSKESIGSVLMNKQFEITNTIFTNKNEQNSANTVYYKIDNSAFTHVFGSNTIGNDDDTSAMESVRMEPNALIRSNCGFTMVQHPVTRFIVAYYKVNALIWNEFKQRHMFPALFEKLKFWRIKDDFKERIRAFVNDLRKYHYLFVTMFPWMDIIKTQTGLLSVSQGDLNVILKYEMFGSDGGSGVLGMMHSVCVGATDNADFEFENADLLNGGNYGVELERDLVDSEFREWMGLPLFMNDNSYVQMSNSDLVRFDILLFYDTISYEIYSKIVEYYWQDFACFNYKADYTNDVLDYLTKYQSEFDGFPVKNRSETNWDRILKYHNRNQ